MIAKSTSLSVLRCENIEYSYGSRKVLDGVSLEIHRGEALGLLGRNGSGKSTLISILIGNYPLQKGEIYFCGEKISPLSPRFREFLGVVFQRPSLDNKLTVLQNLTLAARLHGHFGVYARTRIDAVVEAAGIGEWQKRYVGELSGGMKRRVDIARALIHEPGLLVLDEPTAGLDEVAFHETWDALGRLKQNFEVSILVVTHRPDEAEMCTKLALLDGGKVKVTGSPSELRNRVSKDVLVIKSNDAQRASKLIAAQGMTTTVAHNDVLVECAEAATAIPRLVELVGASQVESVSMRRATLADVFLKLTGHALRDAKEGAPL